MGDKEELGQEDRLTHIDSCLELEDLTKIRGTTMKRIGTFSTFLGDITLNTSHYPGRRSHKVALQRAIHIPEHVVKI